MRELERNKQTIYYALLTGSTEATDASGYRTGGRNKTYSEPVSIRINVSPARGNANREMIGIDCQYSKTLTTADLDCPIQEDSILWIGVPTTEPHNYVVVRKAKSLNDIVYAIREVKLSG